MVVHGYMVMPSAFINQVCSYVVFERICSHNSMHVCFEAHKSMHIGAYVYKN